MRDLFIARQPIFDAQDRIVAYELLYREDADATRAGAWLPTDRMSVSVIVDAVLSLGLSRVTEGRTAFLNVSEEILLGGFSSVLDPATLVVELLETVRPTPAVLEACRDLKARGFRLALDDQSHRTEPGPLLDLADIVKVDVIESGERLEAVVGALASRGLDLLAEKVEDAATHARCLRLGFRLFQGFHYLRPQTLRGRDVDASAVALLRLLAMLGDMSVADRDVEEAFKGDPALSYKLLRIVNSAAVGGRGVDSLAHAMRLVGRDPLQRWLSLLLLTVRRGGGEARTELVRSALVRGRMCELLGNVGRDAGTRGMLLGGTLFLAGLLSQMDVLLGRDLGVILDDVDVALEVRDALLWRSGRAGAVLDAVARYADGDWEGAAARLDEAGIPREALGDAYLDALSWARAHMALHRETA
jgi:EAL and modified HD-GYP domain-containing signal transduction protein